MACRLTFTIVLLAELLPTAVLRSEDAKLFVSSQPEGAAIAVGGQATGRKTPALLDVPAGAAEVTLSLEGFPPVTNTLDLQAGKLEKLRVTFKKDDAPVEPDAAKLVRPETAALQVLVEKPAAAWIFIDGMLLVDEQGRPYETPMIVEEFPQGEYVVTIAKAGFEDLTERYTVAESASPITGTLKTGESRILGKPHYKTSVQEIALPAAPGHGEDEHARLLEKIEAAIEAGRAVHTPLIGGAGGEGVAFMPRDGALLIGLNYCEGWFAGRKIIQAVQPIFLTARGRAVGRWYGTPTKSVQRLEAKSGHAVGALAIRGGKLVDGFSLGYAPIKLTRIGSVRELEWSDWSGGAGGKPTILGGKGQPVIGIVARAGNAIDALGLVLAP